MKHVKPYILMIFLLVAGMVNGYAQKQSGPPPGTEIINQVQALFSNPVSTDQIDINSNTVKVIVQSNPTFSLKPDQVIQTFRGRTVTLSHVLTNRGNVTASFDLSIYNKQGDDFDLFDLAWENRSMQKAANLDTLNTSVTLGPGEQFLFSYSGLISDEEVDKRITSVLNIEAASHEYGVTLHNTDSVKVKLGASVELQKEQYGVGDLRPGDTFTYSLKGTNTGDVAALGRDVIIDGALHQKVVLRDAVPVNLSFAGFAELEKGTALYHTFGAGEFEFITTRPENLESIDVIAVAFDSLVVNESFEVFFDVKVNENATGKIENIADVSYVDPNGTVESDAASNEVVTELPELDAEIDYFTDDDFDQTTGTSTIGSNLHLEAVAAACNLFRNEIEPATIEINSKITGDRETFTATETGPNTGRFRIDNKVQTRDGSVFEVIRENEIIETVEGDELEAILTCRGLEDNEGGGSAVINATVLVDPYGIVFDSEANTPVAGAEVQLIDIDGVTNGGNAGGLAQILDVDGETELQNLQVTAADGKFKFPYLLPGRFRVEVNPPGGYDFASVLSPNQLPEDRTIDSLGSYGLEFEFADDPKGLDFDIPLDPKAKGVLFVEKKVNKKEAEIGDFLYYTVSIKSAAVNTIHRLLLKDELPLGFEYQQGSARMDGEKIDDPAGGKGPKIEFTIGDIEPGSNKELTYKVYVGPGAEKGDGINIAIAESDEAIVKTSNLAKVKVEVSGGVFNNDGYIIGKVFLDCDRDGMQSAGEVGVPGVRLYLENGNYIITDGEGKYTFYAIKPNKHILKLDNYSLPEGSELLILDNRQANDPSSRFVDLKKGEMHRADFAICNCTPAVHKEIENRTAAFASVSSQMMEKDLDKKLSVEKRANNASQVNFDKASGTLNELQAPEIKKVTPGSSGVSTDTTSAQTDSLDLNKLEWALLNAEAGLGFLNVADGDTLSSDRFTFWVKGRRGAKFGMIVNGTPVASTKIGQRSNSKNKDLQAWEFVSIELNEGSNNIQLDEMDPFGNSRGSEQITVWAPGELAKVRVSVPVNDVSADGVSSAVVRVELLDKNNVQVGSRIPIDLDVSMGSWKIEDLDKKKPGTQTFIKDGIREFELTSTIEPQTVTVKANAGNLHDEAKVEFLPDLRPLIAAGIIEGTIRLRNPLNITSTKGDDGFEQELKSLSYDINNFTGDARVAFFLKGKVSGKTLLTAGYDSEKEKEDQLFRDINPDEFYPVYGESSIKGFDAQSSTRLYIRADRNKTYALYGDFITQQRTRERQLGDYSRAQTGVKTHFENNKVQANAFAASSFSSRRIEEMQGQGISRYELPDDDIIQNSEIIEIVTYDRNQPEVILSTTRLTRFADYVIESFSGVITFKDPVSSVDKNFNPVFIRATYEVENNEERYFIGGVDGKVEVAKGVEIGANLVQDNNPTDELTLASGNLKIELGGDTEITAEVANTNTESRGSGSAGRVEIQKKGKKLDLNAQLGKADKDFKNKSATLGSGRTEAKLRGRYKITSSTNVNGELLISRNDTSGAETKGGVINVQHSFGKNINAEVGVRHSEQTQTTSGDITNTNLRSELTADLPFLKGASVSGEYEQDLNNSDKKLMAVGADYRLKNFAKLYARHEFISSAGGRYTLSNTARKNNTVVGIDADYMKNGQVYSEYRIADALDGRSGQAAIGLRNRFVLSEGFGLNLGFERIFTVEGAPKNDGTALSSSVDYTANPNWKGTAKFEARFSKATDTYLNNLGFGYRLSPNWTFLAKNVIALHAKEGISGFSRVQERLRLGAAFRSTHSNRFDALFRYELRYEEDANISDDFYSAAHVVSGHANYHPANDWTFSGRIAAKKSVEQDDLLKSSTFLELVSGRIIHDINDKWDAGVNGSLIANSDFTIKDYGVGIEAGFLVATNLRLAAGYNLFGYEDKDLSANNYTSKGVYAGFSYKFDEQIFRNLAPGRSNSIVDESKYLICTIDCEKRGVEILPFHIPKMPFELKPVEVTSLRVDYEKFERLYFLPKQIHFNNNSTFINQPAAQMLDKVASFLASKDSYYIRLTGHTDSKSSYQYNLDLSEERAKAVRAYFVAAGIEPSKLQFEGLSFNEDARVENDRVDMAANRRVELELNIDKLNVRFIDQVEDLQVNPDIAGIGDWNYVFKAEHNAVPAGFNISNASLNKVHIYMAKRMALALNEYKEITVDITAPAASIVTEILSILEEEGVAQNRISTTVDPESADAVFTYSNSELLSIYTQTDDQKFARNVRALRMMDNLLNIIRSRKDFMLFRENTRAAVIPANLIFENYVADLKSENQAMVSRIGSFMRKSPEATLEIRYTGRGIHVERAGAIKQYLIEWGINESRIILTTATEIKANQIEFNFKNAGSVNLINLEDVNTSASGGK